MPFDYEPFDHANDEQGTLNPECHDASLLGEGVFGRTHKMRNPADGVLVAVKMIHLGKAQRKGVQEQKVKKEALKKIEKQEELSLNPVEKEVISNQEEEKIQPGKES